MITNILLITHMIIPGQGSGVRGHSSLFLDLGSFWSLPDVTCLFLVLSVSFLISSLLTHFSVFSLHSLLQPTSQRTQSIWVPQTDKNQDNQWLWRKRKKLVVDHRNPPLTCTHCYPPDHALNSLAPNSIISLQGTLRRPKWFWNDPKNDLERASIKPFVAALLQFIFHFLVGWF